MVYGFSCVLCFTDDLVFLILFPFFFFFGSVVLGIWISMFYILVDLFISFENCHHPRRSVYISIVKCQIAVAGGNLVNKRL